MTEEVNPTSDALFADAERFMANALRELGDRDIRQAAEKAWRAILASTNALLLARNGEKPRTTSLTRLGLEQEADRDSALESLRLRFFTWEQTLHLRCFYDGNCEPRDAIERRIRET